MVQSIRSKMIIWLIKNRQIFKGKLKKEVVTEDFDIKEFRDRIERGASKREKLPESIKIRKVNVKNIPAEFVVLENAPKNKLIFFTHGGGYVSGSLNDHRSIVAKFVKDTGINAIHFEYGLAPENKFPKNINDSIEVYMWVLDQGYNSENILIAGESAGGGLAISTLMALKDKGLPLPIAGVALSPWLDMTVSGNSHKINRYKDISLINSAEVWSRWIVEEKDLKNPWISPIFGELKGLPSILIQIGDKETMLDDSLKFAKKSREEGIDITLSVHKNMVHCFSLFSPAFPEAKKGWKEIVDFIKGKLIK